eukprot:TRINITY_DN13213_c0_g1_i5.p1 TRINITY_DN13213_c0_g1~~TRINITY_DN13213_c0_g1_i5.p1  ORF type:complete len:249 (+),score=75.94 TRINITY_DN13213_c0_g1_i5:153-899(+)
MKYKLLPGLCRSNTLSRLSEDITTLTRLIKAEKPLTLKPSKKNPLKVLITIEDYLASIDIGMLDMPSAPVNSVGDVVALIGAKDEKEAIGAMYQALSLVEVYFNRMIQHVLMSLYNANKANADKSVNEYFESELNVVNELLEKYKETAVKNKKAEANVNSSEFELKYKELQREYDSLRGRFDKLLKECEALKKGKESDAVESKNKAEIAELKAVIADLKEKLNKDKILKTIEKQEAKELHSKIQTKPR